MRTRRMVDPMIYRYFPFFLQLNSPTIITAIGGQGASGAGSLTYIPGSAIRGVAASRLGDPKNDPDKLRKFKTLILSGQVCYLNAYPYSQGLRLLPRPLSLRCEEDISSRSDTTLQVLDLAAPCDPPKDALRSPAFEYMAIGVTRPFGVSPVLGVHTHHQRDRELGRPGKERGTVFHYEHIKPGQEFAGMVCIWGQSEQEINELAQCVKVLLKPPLMLGRSWHSGYGGNADITWLDPQEREVVGGGIVRNEIHQGDIFRVMLTAPCVVRLRATGQYDPSAFEDELFQGLDGVIEPLMRFYGYEIVGGFNKKWRTDAIQALALAAGSVLVLRAKSTIPFESIKRLENQGIGERRTEGFGRLVFLERPVAQMSIVTERTVEATRPEGEAPELVKFIERRILERALKREVEDTAAVIVRKASGTLPEASLLAGLLIPLRGEPERGLQALRQRLLAYGAEGPRKPAVQQLKRCYVHADRGRTSLLDWMRDLVGSVWDPDGTRISEVLSFPVLAQRHFVISEDSAMYHLLAMRAWAMGWLLDCVLSGLARRKRREAGEDAHTTSV